MTIETDRKRASDIIDSITTEHSMTQREIADQLAVSEATAGMWARDESIPHPDNLDRLEHLLAVGPVDRAGREQSGETWLVRCRECGIEGLEPCPEDVARNAATLHQKWQHIDEDVDVSVVRAWPEEVDESSPDKPSKIESRP